MDFYPGAKSDRRSEGNGRPKSSLEFSSLEGKADFQVVRIERRRSAGRIILPRTSGHCFSLRWIMLFRAGRGLVLCGAGASPVALEVFCERVPPLLPEAWNAFCIGIGCHSFPSIGCLFGCSARNDQRTFELSAPFAQMFKSRNMAQAGSCEN